MIKYREYRTVKSIKELVVTVGAVDGATIGELCELINADGTVICATVIAASDSEVVLRAHGSTSGMSIDGTCVRFTGKMPRLAVSENMLGRCFDGLGAPCDGGPRIISDDRRALYTPPQTPAVKHSPTKPITTGLTAIDACATLLIGQKLAVLYENGTDVQGLISLISSRFIRENNDKRDRLVISVCIGGNDSEKHACFQRLDTLGISDRSISFASTLQSPLPERLATPYTAMAAAEYFAIERGMQVLVSLYDMSAYSAAYRALTDELRLSLPNTPQPTLSAEVSAILERAGVYKSGGSITVIAAASVGSSGAGDVVRRASEGCIALSASLARRGVFPAIDITRSYSELMVNVKSTSVRPEKANELVGAYARLLCSKEDGDIALARMLEQRLIRQADDESRTAVASAAIVDELLAACRAESQTNE